MSGGAYEYAYYKIQAIADLINEVEAESTQPNTQLLALAEHLKLLANITKDAEWYRSGDTSEEVFNIKFNEFMKEFNKSKLGVY